MRQRAHWLALHGFVRGVASIAARRGDPQARLVADPAVRADPIAFYEELRSHGPLVASRIGYLTVDHAVAHALLRSDDFRVFSPGSNLPAPLRWLETRTRDDLLQPLRPPSLLAVEPPEHTRYRKTVSSVFTPKAVAALGDRVQRTAEALLDGLAGDAGVVDVVDRYCSQLPVAIISDILGVPERDRMRVLEYGELAAPSLDFGVSWPQYRRVQHGVAGFNAWLADHLRQLRRAPGDDLMSELIRTAEAGDPDTQLNETELRAVAGLVLAAGFETTVNLLGNGIRMLLDAPQQRETLRQRPELWAGAVEEILRLDSPVQLTARMAGTDTEVAGTAIRRGEVVVIGLAAANRDPAVFPDPHRFDLERANAGRHLAFSGGRHFCLGAALARAEGQVGLRAFFDRFPEAQDAGPGRRRDTRVLRGWSTLPVRLGEPVLASR
ncbi:cytochrome P450 [Mycobacterium sp. pUA109]|uniref:cytochrome P450 n=1 Tax=Mycobacterium sp. pUA109 TaxID=3238982 RepID=UPI00351B8384